MPENLRAKGAQVSGKANYQVSSKSNRTAMTLHQRRRERPASRGLADERIGLAFFAEGACGAVAADEHDVVAEREQLGAHG